MITRSEFIAGLAGTLAAAGVAVPTIALADEAATEPDISWFDNPVDHTADGEIVYGEKKYETFGPGADKVYVITGAARGIGKECARRFLKKGHVILFDILKDQLLATREEFEYDSIYSVTAMNGDVRNPEHVKALAELAKSMGTLGGIVNDAGICALQGTPEQIFDTNLVSLARVNAEFIDQCVPGTVVVNIGSNSEAFVAETPESVAILEDPFAPDFIEKACELAQGDPSNAYYWSKLGVKIHTRRQALEWGKRGGRMVDVAPGLIHTEMGKLVMALVGDWMQWAFDPEQASVPRWGTPQDIANMTEFLASDAASWCTGDSYLVDGGQAIPNWL